MDFDIAARRQTADAVLDVCPAPLFALDELRERNWGVLEGQLRAEMDRDATPQGGESPQDFSMRTRAGLALVCGPAPILIVAHSGTAREIHALAGLSFTRPGNCDILHFQRKDDRHWIVRKL